MLTMNACVGVGWSCIHTGGGGGSMYIQTRNGVGLWGITAIKGN